MIALVVLTLMAVGLIVVAVALALITILLRLRKTLSTLRTVNVDLRAAAGRVEPLQPMLTEVNEDLDDANHRLHAALQA
jgi:uncharacterized protein (DUF3084 family)